jgi:hypothetical protein
MHNPLKRSKKFIKTFLITLEVLFTFCRGQNLASAVQNILRGKNLKYRKNAEALFFSLQVSVAHD